MSRTRARAISTWNLFFSSTADARSWLRGDLHSHSEHSDGDSTVAAVVASAEEKGVDFFALTDHDGNMGGSPTHWFDPDYVSDQTVLLYGVEWTTGPGHANVWSAQPFDYAPLWQAHLDEDPAAALAAAHAQDVLFSINHPTAVFCCPWEYEVPAGTDAVGVWNAMYRLPNFNQLSDRFAGQGLDHYLVGVLKNGEFYRDCNRCFSLVKRLTDVSRFTAMPSAFFSAIRTTNRLPRVTAV